MFLTALKFKRETICDEMWVNLYGDLTFDETFRGLWRDFEDGLELYRESCAARNVPSEQIEANIARFEKVLVDISGSTLNRESHTMWTDHEGEMRTELEAEWEESPPRREAPFQGITGPTADWRIGDLLILPRED